MRTICFIGLLIATCQIVELTIALPNADATIFATSSIGFLSLVFVLLFVVIRGPMGPKGDVGYTGAPGPEGECKCSRHPSTTGERVR